GIPHYTPPAGAALARHPTRQPPGRDRAPGFANRVVAAPALFSMMFLEIFHATNIFIDQDSAAGALRKMVTEPELRVPHNALVLVGDGRKALFLRNKGNPQRISLVVEQILERDNPPTREQGTDRPGRAFASVGAGRSAMEEADWHQIAEERFAGELSEALY